MEWYRKITACLFEKELPQFQNAKKPRVYVSGEWGILQDFSSEGKGYIKFDNGGGQIVRNWDHFLQMVQIIQTENE